MADVVFKAGTVPLQLDTNEKTQLLPLTRVGPFLKKLESSINRLTMAVGNPQ